MTWIALYGPQRPWCPDLLDLAIVLPVTLSFRPDLLSLLRSWHRHRGLLRLCLHEWRLQRIARVARFSSQSAAQVGLARHSSSRSNYQLKWSLFHQWCRSVDRSVSRHSLPKVTDFLLWLRRSGKWSVSSIMGSLSMCLRSSVSSSPTCP